MLPLTTTFLLFSLALGTNAAASLNLRPIIGILTEDATNNTFAPGTTSEIIASYVKYIEAGGARVVPIWIRKSADYYQDILSKINGVLFAGGGGVEGDAEYVRAGKIIFDIAKKMNDKGEIFPMWGTCLGFELFTYLVAKKDLMKDCTAVDLATKITPVAGAMDSDIFKYMKEDLVSKMQTDIVAIHYHPSCLTPEDFTKAGLDKFFRMLAVNQDSNNMTFVSVIEGRKYPFYAVAFNPEKIMFEWVMSNSHHNIPHDIIAIRVNQYFANFIVDVARRNYHRFPSKEAEDAAVIYNYNALYIGKDNDNSVQESYFFTN